MAAKRTFEPVEELERASKRVPERVESTSPNSVLELQRLAGNRAVASLLSSGGSLPVQPESDRREAEADRVAEAVSRRSRRDTVTSDGNPAGPAVDPDSSGRGGHPLSPVVRRPAEQALGADLSGVRVHTDQGADQLSRQTGATALTIGQDIYFRNGTFRPSGGRDSLLAHELTHTVQQGGATPAGFTPLPYPAAQLKRAPLGGALSRILGFLGKKKTAPTTSEAPPSQMALQPLLKKVLVLTQSVTWEDYRLDSGEEIYLVALASGKALVERTRAKGGGRLWLPTWTLQSVVTEAAAAETVHTNEAEVSTPSYSKTPSSETAEETKVDYTRTPNDEAEASTPGYSKTPSSETAEETKAEYTRTPNDEAEASSSGYSKTLSTEADEETKADYTKTPSGEAESTDREQQTPQPYKETLPEQVPSPIQEATPEQTLAHPSIAAITSKYKDLLEVKSTYKGENLSVEESTKRGLSPRRHAAGAQTSFMKDVLLAQQKQEKLIAELQIMEMEGKGKSAQYAGKVKEAYDRRDEELRAAKLVRDLGLEGPKEQLEAYKVRYLETDEERQPYLVTMGQGGLVQGVPPGVFDTSKMTSYGSGAGWAAFVMAPDGKIFAAEHRIQRFHHSSFMAGGDVAAAGEMSVINGQLKGISNKTGHYWAGEAHVANVLKELSEMGVNLSGVEVWLMSGGRLEKQDEDASTWLQNFLSSTGGNVPSTAPLVT